MAIAAANCWFPGTGCATSYRLLSSSRRPTYLYGVGKPFDDHKKSLYKSAIENKVITQKFPTRSQSTASESVGVPKKDNNGSLADLQEQQVETGNLQDACYLNAVVKVYTTRSESDYSLPWQKQRQYASTASAFMIGGGKLLTNAHCVEHATQVKVRRRGDDTKYVAKVLARGIECDLALLSVESEEFFQGVEPLRLGRLPNLQDSVTVVGYPRGGKTISVSKGVVSRIEVTPYDRFSSKLLGIQIDAAINPGNSGGPAFNDQGECIGVVFQAYISRDVRNIGYVIPTTVVSHFLEDYERNGKYTGFPSLEIVFQKLENPALQAMLKVPPNEGLYVLGHAGGTPSFMLSPPNEKLVEKYFHPDNMSSAEKLKLELKRVRDEFKMSESDCGSARVQVAQLTTKIKHLSNVLQKKDKHSQKGLQEMVQRRKKLLKYLRRTDWDSYCLVLSKLGLRDNPDIKA